MAGIVAGLAIGLFLGLLGYFRRKSVGPAKRRKDGWRALRPRWVVRVMLAAIILLIGYALVGGFWQGSVRPGSGPQYVAAMVTFALTTGLAALIVWPLWSRTICWNETELRMRPLIGKDSGGRFADIGLVRYASRKGRYTIVFLNGQRVEFTDIMHGSRELLDRLPKHLMPT